MKTSKMAKPSSIRHAVYPLCQPTTFQLLLLLQAFHEQSRGHTVFEGLYNYLRKESNITCTHNIKKCLTPGECNTTNVMTWH